MKLKLLIAIPLLLEMYFLFIIISAFPGIIIIATVLFFIVVDAFIYSVIKNAIRAKEFEGYY